MEKAERKVVAERLEAVRKVYGIATQREFAQKAGLTEQTYSDVMRLRRDLSLAAARKLAARYALTLDFIYLGNKAALPQSILIAL